MPRPDRRGFTLIEVMVAITIGALVLLAARVLLGGMVDGAERITAAAAETDRDANAERLLRALVASAEPGGLDGPKFVGDARGTRFSTWCDTPAGWQERCEVFIGFVRAGERNVVALELPGDEIVPLRRGFASGSIVYLTDPREGGQWLREWNSSLAIPLALGLVLDGDTVIVRIGERG